MDNFSEFLRDRYHNQLNWLNKKAKFYKRCYAWGNGAMIVISAIIPVLIQLSDKVRVCASVLSIIVSILGGLLSRFAPYRLWQQYRMTAETLVAEYWSFQTGIGEYKNTNDSKGLFAERVQAILKTENEDWIKLHSELQISLTKKVEA